ncbi:MAG: hypothetical protein WCX28_04095 [Bacteriovoracaceae bacterium]
MQNSVVNNLGERLHARIRKKPSEHARSLFGRTHRWATNVIYRFIRFIDLLFSIVAMFFLSSCFSTIPEPKYIAPPKPAVSHASVSRSYLPEGWADITSKAKLPQIKLWLVNRDFSGTMVLRELQPDAGTQQILLFEEINLIATMSLRSKIPDSNPDYRVTRVPAVIDMKRNFSSYAYTEKGLLRRVIVFKKKLAILELELLQEQSVAEFDTLTNDLVTFATTLYERYEK